MLRLKSHYDLFDYRDNEVLVQDISRRMCPEEEYCNADEESSESSKERKWAAATIDV